MKKQILWTFVLLLAVCNSLQSKENYFGYYKSIHKAECCIEKADYANALTIYKDAFGKYPHAFYDDLHNACLCAINTTDYQNAYNYAKQLVSHGCEAKYFNDSIFLPLKNSVYWKDFSKDYDKLRKQYVAGLNSDERKEYWDLFLLDQSDKRIGAPKNQADSIFYIDAVKTVQLIQEHGFPSYFINKDTLNGIEILFGHDCILYNKMNDPQNKDKYNDEIYIKIRQSKMLDTIRIYLKEALLNGFLTPQDYMSTIVFSDKSNPYGELRLSIDYEKEKVVPYDQYTDEEIAVINARRDSIALPLISATTAQDYINSSWYKEYLFKKIKKALATFKECPPPPVLMSIMEDPELEVRNKFWTPGNDGFRLSTLIGSHAADFYKGL